jgi:hypothetical protein
VYRKEQEEKWNQKNAAWVNKWRQYQTKVN